MFMTMLDRCFCYSFVPSEAVEAFIGDDRPPMRRGMYVNGYWTAALYLASSQRSVSNPYTCGYLDAYEFDHYWYYHNADGTPCVCRQVVNTYERGYEKIDGIMEINSGEEESITLDQEVVKKLDASLLARAY